MTIPKYNVKVKLVGTDGNAFAIMGKVKRALRDAGATDEEVTQYLNDSQSGDYNNLLQVACKWVDVS